MARDPYGPLIVGIAPGTSSSGSCASARLAGLIGLSRDELLARYDWKNLIGYLLPGDRVTPADRAVAASNAGRIAASLTVDRRVLLLGVEVSRAFGFVGTDVLAPLETRWQGAMFTAIPHPSGRNRWFNDPANRERAGDALRSLLQIEGDPDEQ